MTERAYAKINLSLDVIGRREDGYHNIRTVMQTVSLCDIVEIEKSAGITVTTNRFFIPNDNRNLAYKACERFFTATGIKGGARIRLSKRIPVSAGLAGGSSDAAATLRALNRIYRAGLTEEELCGIGAAFGADIPFCIKGGTALCEGIGDIITPLPPLPALNVVISVGGEGMSTPAMYAEIDKSAELAPVDTDGMVSAIKTGDISGITACMGNVFEPVCAKKRPFVEVIKKIMLESGAQNAIMSGSGPSVFGIFPDRKTAEACAGILKGMGYYAVSCTTVSGSGDHAKHYHKKR